MPNQEPAAFNFWWPMSDSGGKVMLGALAVIGVLAFIKGCIDEELPFLIRVASVARSDNRESAFPSPDVTIAEIMFFYFFLNVVGWYFIFNIGRFVYSRIRRSETVQAMQETRHEKAELEALRRRREIEKLKKELGEDDREEQT